MITDVVFKVGMPSDMDETEAHDAAVALCEQACQREEMRLVGEPVTRTLRTEAHDAAGEYLVVVEAKREPDPDAAAAQPGPERAEIPAPGDAGVPHVSAKGSTMRRPDGGG